MQLGGLKEASASMVVKVESELSRLGEDLDQLYLELEELQ